MSKPITPAEAKKQLPNLPDEVFDAFNELIVKHLDGKLSGFRQDEAIKLIIAKFKASGRKVTGNEVCKNSWLDVEEAYRKAGWIVRYDKPGFNETYPATFEFTIE